MKEIVIVVRPDKSLKEQNLLPIPKQVIKPVDESKSEQYNNYLIELEKYNNFENSLPIYTVNSMICDSGMIVCGTILAFTPGKKFNARILKDNIIQIF